MTDRFELQERVLRVVRWLYPLATTMLILMDVLAWSLAAGLAIYLRFGLTFDGESGRGFWQVLFSARLSRRVWPAGSEDALPEIGLRPVQAFAKRHGYLDRPGPADLPSRVRQRGEPRVAAGGKSG